MKLAYVVVVHTGAPQVVRLVRRLASPQSAFVVHVDRRSNGSLRSEIESGTRGVAPVEFVDAHRCYWGGFGMVRAALKGLDALVEGGEPFDYAVLLSGQDYPLRHSQGIERFLAEAGGRSFLNAFPLPRATGWGARGGLDRIEDWHLVRRRALHLRLPRPRRLPFGLAPFGGSAWWCLSHEVAAYVQGFARDNPAVVSFFEHTLHPSELFFQTIVMNSPLAPTVVDDSLRLVKWAAEARSPVTLTTADTADLLASPALFARKFDARVDAAILDVLDEHLERQVVAPSR
ncbi:MAG: beta-1,6-N-acetylglucosaminyltransferase, partial [Thermoleophilia bacterium]|nr:beta-1,6-N-acetylglucosaminyltransferase [Thermoleophilia bacterium]